MSITVPKGFRAAGIAAGVKSSGGRDLALVVNDGPRTDAAAVFTSNRCLANPVIWSKDAITSGTARAVILNSGGANCFTGPFGFETTRMTAQAVAEHVNVSSSDVLVCSTGLIGTGGEAFRSAVLGGVPKVVEQLGNTASHASGAAEAILTTDSRIKEAVRRSPAGWTIGAMAKGAGMLAPGLATMLVVITTDAVLTPDILDRELRAATRVTLNRVDSDGCMSTNDTVALLSSGASGIEAGPDEFGELLTACCADLAKQLQEDAEGSSHDITIDVTHAATEQDAEDVARAISRSNLFKAAIYGKDPNWGRVLAAAGTTTATFDPAELDVSLNGVMVCRQGTPHERPELVNLESREVHVELCLHAGTARATILTNDLTHEYVHENSAYSS